MRLPAWLWPRPRVSRNEVEEMQKTIKANDLAIEATQPIVEEAVRRTQAETDRLRLRTGTANRRLARDGSLLQDLAEGWARGQRLQG